MKRLVLRCLAVMGVAPMLVAVMGFAPMCVAVMGFAVVGLALPGAAAAQQAEAGSAPRHWFDAQLLLKAYPRYATVYRRYTPYYRAVESIGKTEGTVEVLAFYGTWCKDSRREVPRLLKLADVLADEPVDFYVDLIPVNRQHLRLDGGQPVSVVRTPTLVVYLNGRPIGRIEEKAKPEIAVEVARMLIEAAKQPPPEGLSKQWRAESKVK